MGGSFDAYHKWLGIPPQYQPPNHYRLLGLSMFEADSEAISAAADQRMSYIRTLQTGEHARQAAQLLNEVARARVCLLDLVEKANYDSRLSAECAELPFPPRAMSPASAQEETAKTSAVISQAAASSANAACPKCKHKLSWNVFQAGRGVTCPQCGSVVPMPGEPSSPRGREQADAMPESLPVASATTNNRVTSYVGRRSRQKRHMLALAGVLALVVGICCATPLGTILYAKANSILQNLDEVGPPGTEQNAEPAPVSDVPNNPVEDNPVENVGQQHQAANRLGHGEPEDTMVNTEARPAVEVPPETSGTSSLNATQLPPSDLPALRRATAALEEFTPHVIEEEQSKALVRGMLEEIPRYENGDNYNILQWKWYRYHDRILAAVVQLSWEDEAPSHFVAVYKGCNLLGEPQPFLVTPQGFEERFKSHRKLGILNASTAIPGLSQEANAAPERRLTHLLEMLTEDPMPGTRAQAAQQIGLSDVPAADTSKVVTALADALDDVATEVRYEAVKSLGRMGADAKSTMPSLVKLAYDRSHKGTQMAAFRAMAQIDAQSRELREGLRLCLIGGPGTVARPNTSGIIVSSRRFACDLLGTLGDDAKWATPHLLNVLAVSAQDLDSPNSCLVFASAARCLAKFSAGERRVITALTRYKNGVGMVGLATAVNEARIVADTALRTIENTPRSSF